MTSPAPHAIAGDAPPRIEARQDAGFDALCSWLETQAGWLQERLTRHGALLLRVFEVEKPADFERVARSIDPQLRNEYLGTSPRDGLTDYVFNASELPDFFPIPQHCEVSRLPYEGHRHIAVCWA